MHPTEGYMSIWNNLSPNQHWQNPGKQGILLAMGVTDFWLISGKSCQKTSSFSRARLGDIGKLQISNEKTEESN